MNNLMTTIVLLRDSHQNNAHKAGGLERLGSYRRIP